MSENKEMECSDCEYLEIDENKEPCKSCIDGNKWVKNNV